MRTLFFIGSPADVTLRYLRAISDRENIDYKLVDLDAYLERGSLVCWGGRVVLGIDEESFVIEASDSVYARLFNMLPPGPGKDAQVIRLAALTRALQVSPARVIPRPLSEGWNTSKPLHMVALKEAGFLLPPTMLTSNPEKALRFIERHDGRVIYKGVSSIKTIVRRWAASDIERLSSSISCPILLQKEIVGPDVRVHMVEGGIFAEEIYSPEVDYRFSDRKTRRFNQHSVPKVLINQIGKFCAKHDLSFSGTDFKLEIESVLYYCLEINCNPAFEGYDFRAGGKISHHLLQALGASRVNVNKDSSIDISSSLSSFG